MNNEIKEIIDKLKDDDWYDELDLTGTMWIELRWEETHILLDYITNLRTIEQQYSVLLSENTDLKEELNKYKFPDCKTKDIEVVRANLVDMMRKNKRLEQENERLSKKILLYNLSGKIPYLNYRKVAKDYKSRCEKLREYINTHQLFKYIYDEEELFEIITDKEAKKDLENILNGGDDNEKFNA